MIVRTHSLRPRPNRFGRTLLAAALLAGVAGATPKQAKATGADAPPADLALAIERALAETDYAAVWQVGTPFADVEAAWQAPNRRRAMRTYFLDGGPRLAPRTQADGSWDLGLSLRSIVRGAASAQPAKAAPVADGARVRYERGDLVEWYVNGEEGLEQGFDLATRPLAGSDDLLELHFALSGGLEPELATDGRSVRLIGPGGRTLLSMTKLFASDADGRTLASRFALRGDGLALVVDDSNARYPIVIDPMIATEEATLEVSGEVAGALLGTSIDLEGDRAVVGAVGGAAGVAYVFDQSAGSWSLTTKLHAADGAPGAGFGADVATNGELLAIGARSDGQGGHRSGAVYVYERQANGSYELMQKLLSPTPEQEGNFGAALDLSSGSRLLVGAPRENSGGEQNGGKVHAYQRQTDGTWNLRHTITPPASERDGLFGQAVDAEGSVAAIGAPGMSHSEGTGVVRVYQRSPISGVWLSSAQLEAPATGDLGRSVDLEGATWIVAGSPRTDFAGKTDNGAIALFERIGSSWVRRDLLFGFDNGSLSGTSVAVSEQADGDVLVVDGQPGRNGNDGAVVLHIERNTGLGFVAQLSGTSAIGSSARLGTSVAMGEGMILAGAPQAISGNTRPGRVAVFRELGAWSFDDTLRTRELDSGDEIGRSVAISGDLAVLGSPGDDERVRDAGAAYVFENDGSAWSLSTKLHSLNDNANGGRFGASVATDGISIVVGAPREQVNGTGSGAAYVFRRDILGNFGSPARLRPDAPVFGAFFGQSVAISGNRAVVGAPRDTGSTTDSGAAYVFEQNFFWFQTQKLTLAGGGATDMLGSSVAFDGTQILVGAPQNDLAGPNMGLVVHYRLNPVDEYSLFDVISAPTSLTNVQFGASVALSGPRLAVGAPAGGRVFLFQRALDATFAPEAQITRPGPFGRDVALAGDVLAVGYNDGASAYRKSGNLWVETELVPSSGYVDIVGLDAQPVSASGDLVLVGDPFQDVEVGGEGRAYVFRVDAPAAIQAYGFGDGSGSACPCGNESPVAQRGCANSTGEGAGLEGLGSASVSQNDLVLRGVGLVPGQTAQLFVGDAAGQGAPFGDGLRVALGQTRRLAARQASASGTATWAGLAAGFAPGDVRSFQVLYRDTNGSPCGARFNLTSGVQVVFQP